MSGVELSNHGLVVAFCGASGTGKSYLNRAIKQEWPGMFNDAVVATTRQPRPDQHEVNRAFMSEQEFDQAIAEKRVIVPHRPFTGNDSPRYGFLGDLVTTTDNTLVEVHASLLAPFRRLLTEQTVLIFGVTVPHDVLSDNLRQRQGEQDDGVSIEARLAQAGQEHALIVRGVETGVVDAMVSYAPDVRERTEEFVLNCVHGVLHRREA